MANERLDIKMTIQQGVMALTGGHPGAVSVCVDLLKHTPFVDPDNILQGIGNLSQLDSLNIWDDQMYILYKYGCNKEPVKLIALLRAKQLGGLEGVTKESLVACIRERKSTFDHEAILKAVQERLPAFNNPEITALLKS